jgi:hypothetical protein
MKVNGLDCEARVVSWGENTATNQVVSSSRKLWELAKKYKKVVVLFVSKGTGIKVGYRTYAQEKDGSMWSSRFLASDY